MSRLTPSLLALDKGLDLQTAKIIAPEGSVFDTINYEQVDFQGQKRIDGYTRYDGSALSAVDEYRVMVVDSINGPSTDRDLLFYEGKLLGVIGQQENTTLRYVVIDHNIEVFPDTAVQVVGYSANGESSSWSTNVISDVSGQEDSLDTSIHYEHLLSIMSSLRSKVEELPGPIAGLHWFQDRLYAVASMVDVIIGATPATLSWSNTKKSQVFSLSDQGKRATASQGQPLSLFSNSIKSKSPKSSGKWYVEIQVTAGAAGNVTFRAGLAKEEQAVEGADVTTAGLGATSNSWCMTAGNGECYYNGNFNYFGGDELNIYSPSDRWGIAYDADTGKVWFRKVGVGTWRGGGDPSTGISPSYTAQSGLYFAASLSSTGGSPEGEFLIVDEEDAIIPIGFAYWED